MMARVLLRLLLPCAVTAQCGGLEACPAAHGLADVPVVDLASIALQRPTLDSLASVGS